MKTCKYCGLDAKDHTHHCPGCGRGTTGQCSVCKPPETMPSLPSVDVDDYDAYWPGARSSVAAETTSAIATETVLKFAWDLNSPPVAYPGSLKDTYPGIAAWLPEKKQ